MDILYIVDKYPDGLMVLYHYVLDVQMQNYTQNNNLTTRFKQMLPTKNLIFIESVFNI